MAELRMGEPLQGSPSTIQVQFRTVYGVERIYPVAPAGEMGRKLTRRATVTLSELALLSALGHRIETVADPSHAEKVEGAISG